MSRFWVYSNVRRGRLLIHRSECPACEGDKPFVLQSSAQQRSKAAWERADSFEEALQIATAFAAGSTSLSVLACAICDPAEPRAAGARPVRADRPRADAVSP